MDTRTILLTAFDNQIKETFKNKTEVKNWLLNHERKNTCIDNLMSEIKKTELKKAVLLNRETIEMLGKDYANSFSKISLRYQEEQAISAMERSRRLKDAEENEEIAKLFEEEVEQIDRSREL